MPYIFERPRSRSRIQPGWLSLPVLAFGFCVCACLTQPAALGQAQLGAAESCFDQGPDKPPVLPTTSIPALSASLPARREQIVTPPRLQLASTSMTKPPWAVHVDTRARRRWEPELKVPDETLTEQR